MKPWKFWTFLVIQTIVQAAFASALFLMYAFNQGPDEIVKKIASDGAECYVYRSSLQCNTDMYNVWTRFNKFPFSSNADEEEFYKNQEDAQ